jgi:3-oxoacid CoA-transferase subunit A
MNKVVSGADEAIRDIEDGMTLMLGGAYLYIQQCRG